MQHLIRQIVSLILVSISLAFVPSSAFSATEVDRDMQMLGLTDALEKEDYETALEHIIALKGMNFDLPATVTYFEGEAHFHTCDPVSSANTLRDYADMVGSKGRYYREALEILLRIDNGDLTNHCERVIAERERLRAEEERLEAKRLAKEEEDRKIAELAEQRERLLQEGAYEIFIKNTCRYNVEYAIAWKRASTGEWTFDINNNRKLFKLRANDWTSMHWGKNNRALSGSDYYFFYYRIPASGKENGETDDSVNLEIRKLGTKPFLRIQATPKQIDGVNRETLEINC